MRLVLCDSNRILSEALAAAMEARGHEVVAIATTVADGLTAVARYEPELVMLDACCPAGAECPCPDEAKGLSAAALLRKLYPRVAVLLLASRAAVAVPPEATATAAGVAGFLGKDKPVSEIAEALELIARGQTVIDPALAARPGQRLAGRRTRMAYDLTPREREVLRRLVAAESTGKMAREMDITTSTLRTYVKNVLSKLGAHSRLQAAALAAQVDAHDELPARTAGAVSRAPGTSPSGVRMPPPSWAVLAPQDEPDSPPWASTF